MGAVSYIFWVLGNWMLPITAHALMESLLACGLMVTGSVARGGEFIRLDTQVLNRTARRVAGAGFSVGRGIFSTLADLRTAHNRFLLKTANVFDRIPGAKST